jgi:hypothetical protein
MKTVESQWSATGRIALPNEKVLLQCHVGDVAKYHTVQLDADLTQKVVTGPAPKLFSPLIVEAKITWSVAGNSVTRRVSVANGVAISGLANHINVEVYPVLVAGSIWNVNLSPFQANILAAAGVRPNIQQPPTLQLTSIEVLAPPNLPVDILVPHDAGITSVFAKVWSLTGSFPAEDSEVIMFASQEGPVFNPQRSWNPAVDFSWVPFFGSCDTIQLVNHDTLASGNSLYYSIVYGIEG